MQKKRRRKSHAWAPLMSSLLHILPLRCPSSFTASLLYVLPLHVSSLLYVLPLTCFLPPLCPSSDMFPPSFLSSLLHVSSLLYVLPLKCFLPPLCPPSYMFPPSFMSSILISPLIIMSSLLYLLSTYSFWAQ